MPIEAMANIPMDGQMLKLLIKSCQDSAESESCLFRKAQYKTLASMLDFKLKEFHAASYEAMAKKYQLNNKETNPGRSAS